MLHKTTVLSEIAGQSSAQKPVMKILHDFYTENLANHFEVQVTRDTNGKKLSWDAVKSKLPQIFGRTMTCMGRSSLLLEPKIYKLCSFPNSSISRVVKFLTCRSIGDERAGDASLQWSFRAHIFWSYSLNPQKNCFLVWDTFINT